LISKFLNFQSKPLVSTNITSLHDLLWTTVEMSEDYLKGFLVLYKSRVKNVWFLLCLNITRNYDLIYCQRKLTDCFGFWKKYYCLYLSIGTSLLNSEMSIAVFKSCPICRFLLNDLNGKTNCFFYLLGADIYMLACFSVMNFYQSIDSQLLAVSSAYSNSL
jgi:hypothetical protein